MQRTIIGRSLEDGQGRPTSVELASSRADQLVPTLPRIVRRALTAEHEEEPYMPHPVAGLAWRLR